MTFRDVPSLQKFEHHARAHSENELVLDCYVRIRALLGPVPRPAAILDFATGTAPVDQLRASCEAVEKATRLMWACAAATDRIVPRLWDYVPDYEASIGYFCTLDDLELMAVTKRHRLAWDEIAREGATEARAVG